MILVFSFKWVMEGSEMKSKDNKWVEHDDSSTYRYSEFFVDSDIYTSFAYTLTEIREGTIWTPEHIIHTLESFLHLLQTGCPHSEHSITRTSSAPQTQQSPIKTGLELIIFFLGFLFFHKTRFPIVRADLLHSEEQYFCTA